MRNYQYYENSNDFEMEPPFNFDFELYDDNLNLLLTNMVNHVLTNMYSPINYDRKLYCSSLDEILLRVRDNYPIVDDIKKLDDINVVLCTDLHWVGGHSRIAMTFNSNATRNYYILTDILNQNYSDLEKINFLNKSIGKDNYYILPNGTPLEKFNMIINEIKKISPRYLSCFNHQFDPICILATLYFKKCKRFFYHHCDHTVSIGASIKEFIHIDTNDYVNSICRSNISDSFTLPLSIPMDVQLKQKLEPALPISFVSVGAHHKYDFLNVNSTLYYPKIITLLLSNSNTIFFHAGELFTKDLEKIYNMLDIHEISCARFNYLGNINSLQDYFLKIPNKIFIPSFPKGGGLAFVEFLSIGTPVLLYMPSNCDTISSKSSASLVNSSVLLWETHNELIEGGNKILSDYLLYSKNSLDLYIKKYSYNIYKFYLNKIFN